MYHRNDGSIKDNAVQNRFTAYLKQAIHNKRIDYLYKQNPNLDSLTDSIEYLADESEDPLAMYAEYDLLKRALQRIKERERYILLARVIDDKSFDQIASEVGLGYKGTTAVYYCTLKKLHKILEDEKDGL